MRSVLAAIRLWRCGAQQGAGTRLRLRLRARARARISLLVRRLWRPRSMRATERHRLSAFIYSAVRENLSPTDAARSMRRGESDSVRTARMNPLSRKKPIMSSAGLSKTICTGVWTSGSVKITVACAKTMRPKIFGILRHMAINLLKREKSLRGAIQTKRLKAAWDHDYLFNILCP
jgi:hypothetical protein